MLKWERMTYLSNMAKKQKKKQRRFEIEKVPQGNCPFCKAKANPDYKDFDNLAKFVTDRAKILSKDRTGVCSKHQRKLGVAIKRARHLALLPFVAKI